MMNSLLNQMSRLLSPRLRTTNAAEAVMSDRAWQIAPYLTSRANRLSRQDAEASRSCVGLTSSQLYAALDSGGSLGGSDSDLNACDISLDERHH